jgi:hypothetical protein
VIGVDGRKAPSSSSMDELIIFHVGGGPSVQIRSEIPSLEECFITSVLLLLLGWGQETKGVMCSSMVYRNNI